jgi:hypothetical protein
MNNRNNIHYFWRLLIHLRTLRASGSQSGYAMLVTSILAILVFSMLSVYLFSANLYKSVATSIVDSGTTFYAAESALNKRANMTRARFEAFQVPTGTSPAGNTVAEQMMNCMSTSTDPAIIGTGDLGCRPPELQNLPVTALKNADGSFKYKEPTLKTGGNGYSESFTETRDTNANINYRTFSFLRYYPPVNNGELQTIENGEPFAGLKMIDNRYRLYVSAAKQVSNNLNYSQPIDNAAQTMLQMEISNRLIPIFQFAAFYEADMEITSSSAMTIGGPVHSNGAIRMAPGGTLTLNNKMTAVTGLFKGLEFVATWGGADRIVRLANGTSISVNDAWDASGVNAPVTATEINNSNGQLNPNVQNLRLPDAGDLDRAGIYAQKADVKVDFTPLNTSQPFTVTALGRALTAAELQSLRQPVLAMLQSRNADQGVATKGSKGTGEENALCPAITKVDKPAGLNPTVGQKDGLRKAMQAEMLAWIQANPTAPTAYNFLNSPFSTVGSVTSNLQNKFNTYSTGIVIDSAWTWHQLAAATGDCWLPSPMKQLDNQPDRRETAGGTARAMTILQSDIKSMAVWNRDGRVLNGNILDPVASPLYVRAAATASVGTNAATGYSMEEMNMGSVDTTEGGMVWHFSVNKCSGGGSNSSVNCYAAGLSPYGFGFSGGKYLPGALSLVTDQAAYVQGDYNDARSFAGTTDDLATVPAWSPREFAQKKPAAVMADTIAVLSNSCLDDNDRVLNCFNLTAGGTIPAVAAGRSVGVNAAFLSRTDNTVVNGTTMIRNSGGLNNYFRMIELWGNLALTYSGSMVSLGPPVEFSGVYLPGRTGGANTNNPGGGGYYYYTIPTRNFSFDNTFRTVAGLPPMTPRAVYLKQKVFKRHYNTGERDNQS